MLEQASIVWHKLFDLQSDGVGRSEKAVGHRREASKQLVRCSLGACECSETYQVAQGLRQQEKQLPVLLLRKRVTCDSYRYRISWMNQVKKA